MAINTNRIIELIDASVESSWKFYKLIAENMTIEERNKRRKELIYKSCLTCVNCSCRIESNEKLGNDENGKPMGNECLSWENNELIGRSIVLQKLDIREIK